MLRDLLPAVEEKWLRVIAPEAAGTVAEGDGAGSADITLDIGPGPGCLAVVLEVMDHVRGQAGDFTLTQLSHTPRYFDLHLVQKGTWEDAAIPGPEHPQLEEPADWLQERYTRQWLASPLEVGPRLYGCAGPSEYIAVGGVERDLLAAVEQCSAQNEDEEEPFPWGWGQREGQ